VLQARGHTPTFYPFVVFTFGFVIESIKEFGGALVKLSKKLQNVVFESMAELILSASRKRSAPLNVIQITNI
jgi:hypothetical protein